jgi:hypothetical protein
MHRRLRRHTLHGGRFRMALMDRKPTSGRSLLRNVVDNVRLVDGPFPPRPCRISGIGVASDAHYAAIQCDRAPEGNSLRWPGSVVVAFLMRANTRTSMVTLGRHVEFRNVTLAARAGTAAAIKLTANNAFRCTRRVVPYMATGSAGFAGGSRGWRARSLNTPPACLLLAGK